MVRRVAWSRLTDDVLWVIAVCSGWWLKAFSSLKEALKGLDTTIGFIWPGNWGVTSGMDAVQRVPVPSSGKSDSGLLLLFLIKNQRSLTGILLSCNYHSRLMSIEAVQWGIKFSPQASYTVFSALAPSSPHLQTSLVLWLPAALAPPPAWNGKAHILDFNVKLVPRAFKFWVRKQLLWDFTWTCSISWQDA